jgi:hypothetical protein
MHEFRLHPGRTRPYFAEVPYYVWGEVNYDSEGDCARPRDRNWTCLELTNRKTNERLNISAPHDGPWTVEGSGSAASRACFFLVERCGARSIDGNPVMPAEWDRNAALERAAQVAREFEAPELAPFDSHLFWGSWKWIGWFATEFTWVGRWIMHSVVRKDVRAVALCIDWLRHGTFSAEQSAALRGALHRLTDETFATDQGWIRWYDGDATGLGAKAQYPDPDIDAWLLELKSDSPAEAG